MSNGDMNNPYMRNLIYHMHKKKNTFRTQYSWKRQFIETKMQKWLSEKCQKPDDMTWHDYNIYKLISVQFYVALCRLIACWSNLRRRRRSLWKMPSKYCDPRAVSWLILQSYSRYCARHYAWALINRDPFHDWPD